MAVDVTAAEGITLTTDTRVRSRPARPRRALTAALWYVVLISISLVTILPFVWMLLTSLKGPRTRSSPSHRSSSGPPDTRQLRQGPRHAADPELLPEQHRRRTLGDGPQRAGHRARRIPAGEDALPGPRGDLLPPAWDAHRPGPADLHPELRARGQRLPLRRHVVRPHPSEPRQCVQHLSHAAGIQGSPERSHRGGPDRRSPRDPDLVERSRRSSGRPSRPSRSSPSSCPGTTSSGRR